MARSEIADFLSAKGLWLQPVAATIHEMGLETIEDLRFCFRSREGAAERGGPLLALTWQVVADSEPPDLTSRVEEVLAALADERRALAHLRRPPAVQHSLRTARLRRPPSRQEAE